MRRALAVAFFAVLNATAACAAEKDFSAKYAEDYVKMTPGAKKEAVIIPGAGHVYEVTNKDQTNAECVINTTAEWFAETL